MTSVSLVQLRKTLGRLSVLLLLGGWLGGGDLAHAQPPAHPHPGQGFAAQSAPKAQENPGGRAHVDLTVVYANHSGQVDPRVAQLKTKFASLGFTGFQVMSTHDAQLGAGQDMTTNVEGSHRIELTLVSRTDSQVKVRIQISRNGQKVVDATQTFSPGKVNSVAGLNYQDGKLFLLIKAD